MTKKTSPITLPKKVGIHIQAAALEAAANGILITDAKGVIQWVNHAFSLMTGYGADEAVGKPANLLKSGKQEPKYYRQLWKTVTAGKVWHGELINRRKNGRHYIEEMTITPVYDPGGNLTHFIAIKQDISARRRQEKKIKGSLARIEALYAESEKIRSQRSAILNSAGEAMALINTQGKFVMINRQFERFFSVKKNQVVGRRFADMIPRFGRVFDNPETLKSDLDESLKNPDDPSCRVITQKWPQKRELSVYGKVVRGRANRRIGVLYVFRDVTAEREVDRLKSEFVSLVSHELRTPLTSIMGYVDMILEGEAGPVTEEQADFLAVVKRNTARLTLLVRDLLDVSKIEAGAVKLKNEDLDLAGLIREAAGSLKTQFESKKQKLELSSEKDLPPVQGDPDRLIQVLTNLLSNAHKYTPEGGRITITTTAGGNSLRIEVKDTGIGMSDDEQKGLFTKFYRADNEETRTVPGTGLGLWITRSIVEMHGGEIEIESRKGQGTQVRISLPIMIHEG